VAEEFVSTSGRIHVSVYEKRTRPSGLPANIHVGEIVEQCVELAIDAEPAGIALEIPLEEFHDLFYRKVFPAVARRISKARSRQK
jgi:hypothetical protein